MFSKANIALLLVSTLLAVYLLEALLFAAQMYPYHRFSANTKIRMQLAAEQGTEYDQRTLKEFVRDQRAQGIAMQPKVSPRLHLATNGFETQEGGRIYPLAGIAHRPTASCNEQGEYLVFDSDRYGFRNPDDLYDSLYRSLNAPLGAPLNVPFYSQGDIEALILGDSFTLGQCVKHDIAALLKAHGISTANLGYSGNGPLLGLAALREYGSQLGAKHVFWIYFEGNDLRDLLDEQRSAILVNYLDPDFSQALRTRQNEIDRLLDEYVTRGKGQRPGTRYGQEWKDILRLRGVEANLHRLIERWQRRQAVDLPFDLFEQVLERARLDVAAFGGELHFVYLPQWERFNEAKGNRGLSVHHDRVLELVHNLGIPVVDMTPIMSASSDPLALFPFRYKGYYTAEGYQMVADEIHSYLNSLDIPEVEDQVGAVE